MKNWITAGVVAGLGFSGLAAAVPVSAVSPIGADLTVPAAERTAEAKAVDLAVSEVVEDERVSAILDEAFATSGTVERARGDATTPQEVTAADRATLEDPRSVAALSKALLEDTEPAVRRVAAWALGKSKIGPEPKR